MMTAGPVPTPVPPRRRRLVILAWTLLGAFVVGGILIVSYFFALFQVARVEGQAMAPTIRDQDRLIVNRFAYSKTAPQRGDIVMMLFPKDVSKKFVKRVVGQPGDRVEVREGRVFLNGALYDDSYVWPAFRSGDDWGPESVPGGYFFVMGDRRNNSSDSRHWGFVPGRFIIGKVTLRWWPVPDARRF